jgi:Flp pilus assembly protein TadB
MSRTGAARHAAVKRQLETWPAGKARVRPPTLRRSTGIVIAVAGVILCLAVHVQLSFLAPQRAGLILLITGVLWLWIPVTAKRDRLQRGFEQLITFLEWDPAPSGDARCSLDDLLEPPGETMPAGPPE